MFRSPSFTLADIGASRIAVARFSSRGETLRLERCEVEPITVSSYDPTWLDAVAAGFARLAGRWAKREAVTLLLPGHLVWTKAMRTPRVAAPQREKVIRFEAEQSIPFALSDVVWGHTDCGESASGLDVLLVAAKSDVVESLCRAVEAAGFAPRAVGASALALEGVLPRVARDEPLLLASLGARSIVLLLRENGRLHLRTIALGPAFDAGAADVNALAARLAQEITRSLLYFRQQSAASPASRVLLTGGRAGLVGLDVALAARLQIPVARLDLLAGVEFAPAVAAARDSVASAPPAELIGAAWRQMRRDSPTVDLRPPRVRADASRRRRQPWFALAAVLAVAAFLPPLRHYREWETALRQKVAALDGEIAPLRAREARNRANLEKLAALQRQIATWQSIAARRASWPQLFADLQDRFTRIEDVWLDRVQLATDPAAADAPLRIAISGCMLDRTNPLANVSPDTFRRVTALLTSVAASPFVAAVENERFDSHQPGVLRFDVVLVAGGARPL